MILSEFQLQSRQDNADRSDHWLAVQHLPCAAYVIGDYGHMRHRVSAAQVWDLMESHRCKPEDLAWVESHG